MNMKQQWCFDLLPIVFTKMTGYVSDRIPGFSALTHVISQTGSPPHLRSKMVGETDKTDSALTHVIDINAEFSFRAIFILIAACDTHHNNNQKPILYLYLYSYTWNICWCFFLPNLHCPSSRSQYWGNYFEQRYLIFRLCYIKGFWPIYHMIFFSSYKAEITAILDL